MTEPLLAVRELYANADEAKDKSDSDLRVTAGNVASAVLAVTYTPPNMTTLAAQQ